MADIGYVSLLLALALALYSAVSSVLGARRNQPELRASSRNALYAVFGLVTLASIALIVAFLTHDFRLEYVASFHSRDTSLVYTLAGFYAGNQGSLLFWAWMLSACGALTLAVNRNKNREIMPYVSAIVMATTAFFLIILIFVSNPFHQLNFAPADGQGLNPLLENPGMIFHPPFTLAGYAGLTIPFAFAIAALITGRLSDEWLRSVRTWTLVFWLFLGLGNLLGAQWAYVELGWGGYWAWDPVENASFMPFLTATAFLHSAMIQKRRGMLKVWNMVLIIITFSLTIFGTFLTRSGIISSVHTFGVSALGPFFLAFIAITLLGSTWLLFSRLDSLRSEDELDSMLSRESSFLLNNLVLTAIAFATFLGVIFPIISEAVRGVKVTVGPPFFNQVNGPIFLLLILVMGICPLIGWRRASSRNLLRNFLYPFVASVVLAAILALLGITRWYALLGFALCGFVLSTIILEWVRGTRARQRMQGENYAWAFLSLVWANRPRYGGYLVHVGIILVAIGIIGSYAYKVEKNASIKPGESINIEQYRLEYEGMDTFPTEKRMVVAATLKVYNGDKLVGTLTPEKRFDANFEQPTTEIALRTNLKEDLYVIMAGWDEIGGVTAFKVLINPLVAWIWIGGAILLFGTLIALWPERPKMQREEVKEQ